MPNDDRRLSVLGFGIMRLPTLAGRIDRKRADAMLLSALKAGVNYFDTAHPYHAGQSEPYLGRFFKEYGRRNDVAIATKLPHWRTRSQIEMENMLAEQLKRLRTSHIDYYLIHNITGGSWESLVKRNVMDFLDGAKKSGKILKAGFSWHGIPEDFKPVVDSYPWDFCQIQYSILDERRQAGTAGLEYAASKGLGVVVMEPLRGGNLAAKIPKNVMDIWRERPDRTPACWALSWVWNRPEISTVLSGLSQESHLNETLALANEAVPGMLRTEEIDMISRARDAYKAAGAIGCTSCRYCMPCPFGVSIPEVFDWYNEWKTIRHSLSQRLFYIATVGAVLSGRNGLASQCTSCGICLKKCPQSLPIPHLMKTISREYEGTLGRTINRIGKLVRRRRNLREGKNHGGE